MARFDVYANPDASERRHTPYFVDVQNDFIDTIETRVVLPLRREAAFGPRSSRLNPLVQVNSDGVVLDTAAIGAVPAGELKKRVGNLQGARDDIQIALDALFGSY
jgi:toxin CcdB